MFFVFLIEGKNMQVFLIFVLKYPYPCPKLWTRSIRTHGLVPVPAGPYPYPYLSSHTHTHWSVPVGHTHRCPYPYLYLSRMYPLVCTHTCTHKHSPLSSAFLPGKFDVFATNDTEKMIRNSAVGRSTSTTMRTCVLHS